jgi:hypothetical protein
MVRSPADARRCRCEHYTLGVASRIEPAQWAKNQIDIAVPAAASTIQAADKHEDGRRAARSILAAATTAR